MTCGRAGWLLTRVPNGLSASLMALITAANARGAGLAGSVALATSPLERGVLLSPNAFQIGQRLGRALSLRCPPLGRGPVPRRSQLQTVQL